MKYGNIFWGVILITLGTLFALRNFDIFFFSWRSVFRLWPLIFVFWGIALLPVKAMMKILLTAATVLVGIIILASNPVHHNSWFSPWTDSYEYEQDYEEDEYPWKKQEFNEPYDPDVEFAALNLDAAAGSFNIKGLTSRLFEFETEGNTGPYSVLTKDVNGGKVIIDFNHKRFKGRSNLEHTVWMRLNDKPVWNFNLDVGAASFDMDLSPFKVENVDIDGGASSITLKLGDRFTKTFVTIDAGASEINIEVPYGMACEVKTSTILSGRELDGFNKIRKGLYQTPDFSSGSGQIFIEIDAAVSGISVNRY